MFADVTSANIVGYQTKAAATAKGRDFMVCTFQKVDGSVIKLSDFGFSEVQAHTANKVMFMNPNGAQLKDGVDSVEFYYVHPGWCTAARAEWKPGWYWAKKNGVAVTPNEIKLGSESSFWANDYEIPYGTGMGIYRTGNNTATLTFSGAVAASDKEIECPNAKGRTWTGNVMPTDYKLKDFMFKEVQAHTANKIMFMNPNGAQLKDGVDSVEFYYVHPDWCTAARAEWKPGWYWAKKNGVAVTPNEIKLGSESTFWAGEYDIPAGQGFGVYRTGNNAATLIVPTPLQ